MISHPNQCFYKGLGYMNAKDEKIIPNECIKALCREDGSILFAGCGTHLSERPCKMIKGDLTQDYPECCPHAICE
ncbi:hypothetical protein WA026_016935 [Henosepilachna vigintioctopunctata]|uniref:Single domain-containing protein n=1 Tax=Henosepilachna vigintioctopunctata TaxID=420089 RepID=A0AAW1UAB5_9CUCU